MKQYSAPRPVRHDNPDCDVIIKNGIDAINRNLKNLSREQLQKATTELAAGSQQFDHNQLCDRIASKSFQ